MTVLSHEKNALWFIFQHDHVLSMNNGNDVFLTDERLSHIKIHLLHHFIIGHVKQTAIHCAELKSDDPLPKHLHLIPFKKVLNTLDKDWFSMATKAYAIIQWDKNHQFCGRCGSQTTQTPHTFERICIHCSLTFYPRISPSIIVLIQKADQILMARSHHFMQGVYALIAGFVEPGETLEEAVHREVKEEVGLTIRNITYFGSQFWPFPDSLMIAYTAHYANGEIKINPAEIEEAGWYTADKIPGYPSSSLSIAKRLIDHFIENHTRNAVK